MRFLVFKPSTRSRFLSRWGDGMSGVKQLPQTFLQCLWLVKIKNTSKWISVILSSLSLVLSTIQLQHFPKVFMTHTLFQCLTYTLKKVLWKAGLLSELMSLVLMWDRLWSSSREKPPTDWSLWRRTKRVSSASCQQRSHLYSLKTSSLRRHLWYMHSLIP